MWFFGVFFLYLFRKITKFLLSSRNLLAWVDYSTWVKDTFPLGLLRCLIRAMSEHREEQWSTIPKMSNSRHILILPGLGRNRCAHSRFHHSLGKVLAGSSLMQSFLLTLNYSQFFRLLQEQGCALGDCHNS